MTSCPFFLTFPSSGQAFLSKSFASSMRSLSNTISSMWIVIYAVWVLQISYASGTSHIIYNVLDHEFSIYQHSFAAYFIIEAPQPNLQWVNNASNLLSWVKGAEDGIYGFDLEMTRKSQDGLFLIARNGKHFFSFYLNNISSMSFSSSTARRNQRISHRRSTSRRLLSPPYQLYHRAHGRNV